MKFKPYGIALTKLAARKMGINPVWYVDRTPGQDAQWEVAQAIQTLKNIETALTKLGASLADWFAPGCTS